jgi:hypothetical protein
MADIAAIALVQERAIRDAQSVVGQLQSALSSRVIIEQAKGVLAARAGIGVDEAFARLRSHAREQNLRLRDVARDVIGGRLGADHLAGADSMSEPGPSAPGNTSGGGIDSPGGSVHPLSRRSRPR